MTHRDRWLDRTKPQVEDEEQQLSIGLVTAAEGGTYTVTVNGRAIPREATVSNEFTFETAGSGKGDEVLLLASGENDLSQIIGLSPWSVHGT